MCHLINRLSSIALEVKTPINVSSRKSATVYGVLIISGSLAYYDVKGDKLDPRTIKVIFMGFRHRVKGFKLYDPKVILSRMLTLTRLLW